MSAILDDVFAHFAQRGHLEYGESVTQLEHALQTATLAESEGAPATLVAAALLHDIGHLLQDEDAALRNIDAGHEESGAAYLSGHFQSAAIEPGRLHVAAKRYLCAVDAAYLADLSPASVHSLKLQGGPFSDREATAFIRQAHAMDAVRLRRWDDCGKVPDLVVPPIDHFVPHLQASLL